MFLLILIVQSNICFLTKTNLIKSPGKFNYFILYRRFQLKLWNKFTVLSLQENMHENATYIINSQSTVDVGKETDNNEQFLLKID